MQYLATWFKRIRDAGIACVLLGAAQPVSATTTAVAEYQDIPQQQLAYLQLEQGTVVLLLADQFTPQTSGRFRQLVQQRFYDGLPFYRVIDQFVLQAGLPEGERHPNRTFAPFSGINAEFSWPVRPQDPFVLVQQDDLLAAQTGFNQGFAVGRDLTSEREHGGGREWLLHCPNVVVMARNSDPNSATTDFAIMQGQAPRHLDKNMAIFARVIWGQHWLNQIQRAEPANGGILSATEHRSKIKQIRLGTELPAAQQLQLQIQQAAAPAFTAKIATRRQRADDFYIDKGNGKLDICYQALSVRLNPAALMK